MLGIMIVVEKCLLRRIFGTKEKEAGCYVTRIEC